MDKIDVKDLRAGARWTVIEPLSGSFGAAEITVVNLAEQGAQLAHAQPLRIATRGRFSFRRGEAAVNVLAMVVWSRLSQTPNAEGKYLYHSGVRIEPDGDEFTDALHALAKQHLLQRDSESLDRKRERAAARESEKAAKPTVKLLRVEHDTIPPDQLLLVQHARERLRTNPEEAKKWYNRARFAVTDDDASDTMHHREEVLAVWEYLERTVPLAVIARVFEKN